MKFSPEYEAKEPALDLAMPYYRHSPELLVSLLSEQRKREAAEDAKREIIEDDAPWPPERGDPLGYSWMFRDKLNTAASFEIPDGSEDCEPHKTEK